MSLVLDAGAFVAIERSDRSVLALPKRPVEMEWNQTLSTPDRTVWTDEQLWDVDSESLLILGDDLGQVRVWVTNGSKWAAGGSDLASLGNTLIWERYDLAKMVDAVPLLLSGELTLFFSLNKAKVTRSASTDYGWGVWRSSALPTDATSGTVFGVDFVVRESAGGPSDTADGDRIGPFRSPDNKALTGTVNRFMIDPDPLAWSTGHVMVFWGQADSDDPANTDPPAFQRCAGTTTDTAVAATDEW